MKHVAQSKTIWLNLVVLVAILFLFKHTDQTTAIGTAFGLGAMNIVLRLFTNRRVYVRRKKPND